jgi:TPR repeat protein
MRATLITALLCTAGMLLPCAHAQQSEADRQALAQLRTMAEKGDAESQCELGRRYYGGQGVATNYVEAVRWWRKAAEQNHAQSQYNLGFSYATGRGVATDYEEAAKWFRKAAEQHHAEAQNNLGFCYWSGQGVAKDYTEAVKWYRKAAEQNYARAQYNLGTCYGQGQGVGKDVAEAVKLFRKAAEQNYAEGQFNLGACYCNGDGVTKDYVEAYKWFLLAGAQGREGTRQTITGLESQLTREQLVEGQKRASDFKSSEASSLDAQRGEPARKPLADLRATAAAGDAQTHKALGQALPAGKDAAAKDSAEAVKWFTHPDNQKQPSGDRAKDEAEASKWYLLALRSNAAAGNAEAQNALGEAFYAGKLGVAKDSVEAVKWFRKAADQNLAAAQSNLGVCYERGDGVAKYEVEAYKWDLLAAAQGDSKGKRNASMLELLLSPEEIAEGKRRAQDWLEQREKSSTNNR